MPYPHAAVIWAAKKKRELKFHDNDLAMDITLVGNHPFTKPAVSFSINNLMW
jgi:hypothetical protein